MKYEICAITDVGCIRQNNEDGFYINNIGCYNTSECFDLRENFCSSYSVCCDGVGGSKAGEEATKICIQTASKK